MRRILIPIIGLLCIMYACSNDLTTIGQDVISNESYVGEEIYEVTRTATVKADSFKTSNPYSTNPTIDLLVMGRYEDKWSGITEATPCFQIAPTSVPSFSNNTVLDSVTFNFSYGGNMWGDTLQRVKTQKYHLYQIKEFPELEIKNPYFYNNKAVNLDTIIGTTEFFPLVENMSYAYFKIDQALGDTLFERMLNRRDRPDDIYSSSSTGNLQYHNFLYYFKGLAIVSDPDNDCLMTIKASDSLYLEFHLSTAGEEHSLKFPLSQREYQYNRIVNTPHENLESLVDSSENEVFFEDIQFSLAQGMCGYMVKLSLPDPPGFGRYGTIVKAQLEIKPEFTNNNPIAHPLKITVRTTNDINELGGALYSGSNQVTGILNVDPFDSDDNLYVFDLTDYYQLASTLPPVSEKQQILLSVYNDGYSDDGVSFDQMVVRETPILRVHYAKYK